MAFAEIIESSLQHCVGQCWKWDEIPSFGQCVVIHDEKSDKKVYALVYNILTGSTDQQRSPKAFGKNFTQLQEEQPQIFHFLKTTFYCIPLCYKTGQEYIFDSLDVPLKIHTFIKNASLEEKRTIFSDSRFSNRIFSSHGTITHVEDLVIASVHYNNVSKYIDWVMLLKKYSLYVENDYKKLKYFSSRIQDTHKPIF